MSLRRLPAADLIQRLSGGWNTTHSGLVIEVLQRWKHQLGCEVIVQNVGANLLQFDTIFQNLWLRGLQEVPCLIAGGTGAEVSLITEAFWKRVKTRLCLPLILTLTDEGYRTALSLTTHGFCVVLSPLDLALLLDDREPLTLFKRCVTQQVPRIRLVPFNVVLPAEGSMFVGRHMELQRLKYQEDISFAIAGPSRIGKTSLAQQFRRQLIREGSPLASSTFYINFYDCKSRAPDEIARWFASHIACTSRSQKVTADTLANFLKYQRYHYDAQLNIILDEADNICDWPGFDQLALGTREAACRIVLCGRGNLLKTMLSPTSYLSNRLDLIRLEPLDETSAKALLLRPIEDLQIRVVDSEDVAATVLRLTGKLPHLVQFYGKKLVDRALGRGAGDQLAPSPWTVSPRDVNAVTLDIQTAQYFVSALREIRDVDRVAYLIALLLLREGIGRVTPHRVIQLGLLESLRIEHARAVDICNDLVINNVLAWDGVGYLVASAGLVENAKRLGYFEDGLAEVRKGLKDYPHTDSF